MFCAQCGATIADGSRFCPRCGTQSFSSTQVSAPPPATSVNPGPLSSPPPVTPGQAASASPWLNVPATPQQTDGKAVFSMILGILSLLLIFIPFIFSLPAVILGHMSRSAISKSMGRLKGEGTALAGLIMGYIGLAMAPIMLLIIAAIAIPNFMRARISANEASAAQTLRTVVTNEIAYSTIYPDTGYAADLSTLGPGPGGTCTGAPTAQHACLVEGEVVKATCTSEVWCTKDGYNYRLTSVGTPVATDFVIVATPIADNTGFRSYCATSDGILRRRTGRVLSPPSPAECTSWEML